VLDLMTEIRSALSLIPVDNGCGCSLSKACAMACLVADLELRVSVDIGVYRGRSLFPLALAHKNSGGKAYGVDPWEASESRHFDRPDLQEELDRFSRETDFESLYSSTEALRSKLGLEQHCELLRFRSDVAICYFEDNDISFDLVHIDGNHDTAIVMSDLGLYAPRLRKGGFLVMDDISWDSVRPTCDRARETMTLLHQFTDWRNDYAIFQLAKESRETRELSARLDDVERQARLLE
jgi:hypothetical protein